jgi:signal transduction histidine kinase
VADNLLGCEREPAPIERLAGIGRLAAHVAREVWNPLSALGTYVQVLQRRGADSAVTDEMQRVIARIDRIVQGLLDYARPRAAAAAVADLNQAVMAVVEFLEPSGMRRSHGAGERR